MRVQYPTQGAVSIWVGTFDSEDSMDVFTDQIVEPCLKLPVPMSSICEVTFEGNMYPVRILLEGFSGWESFIDEACEVAALNGFEEGNGVLVCYHLLCEARPTEWEGGLYLGSFGGSDT